MTELNPDPERREPCSDEEERQVVLDARELFSGSREIVIEHDGIRYRLRITRRNKLILQK
jgi:hemin uptake protein HemP